MAHIVAEIYELQNEIGAGGGGVVYLGRHLRLKKPVVLKADKRRLSTDEETLRREVDLLKGLSHTYIPQVYDFVQEEETVYTVMDYVEGESLDKLLKRKQPIKQKEIIRWSCQLLEALVYLHRQPPYGILHGDIKPANIMLRSNGDICLIDYNIALALGEDGAVKVGFSRGYASPEHYGTTYISEHKGAAIDYFSHHSHSWVKRKKRENEVQENELDKTMLLAEEEILASLHKKKENLHSFWLNKRKSNSVEQNYSELEEGSSALRRKGLLLDVRSDIYSLGATLYHLLSGIRPAQDAQEVIPLGEENCSLAVAKIINKAMEVNPDMRFQSAEEMLTAFLSLPKQDPRVIRYQQQKKLFFGMIGSLFLLGGVTSFIGLKQIEQKNRALAKAEYSADYLAKGDIVQAVKEALGGIPSGGIFDAPVTAQAQFALTEALGVYDLDAGYKDKGTIPLPSAPFSLSISPSGERIAAIYAYEMMVYDLKTDRALFTLPIKQSALAEAEFIDEERIIFSSHEGIKLVDLAKGESIWTGEEGTTISVSSDRNRAAVLNREKNIAILYDVETGEELSRISFGQLKPSTAENDIFANPKDDIFTLNQDGSLLAASFSDGSLWIFNWKNKEESFHLAEDREFIRFQGGFSEHYFAFCGQKKAVRRLLLLI